MKKRDNSVLVISMNVFAVRRNMITLNTLPGERNSSPHSSLVNILSLLSCRLTTTGHKQLQFMNSVFDFLGNLRNPQHSLFSCNNYTQSSNNLTFI